MKKTLVVNFFGSPGSGKSTSAAYLFSKLKMDGVDVELVTEYAKDKCFEEHKFMFSQPENQFYIGAKQFFKVNRVYGKVDVVITDSPVLLSCFYNNTELLGNEYNLVIRRLFNKFNNINFFVNRVKPYNPNGRLQTEEESILIAKKMKKDISNWNIPFFEINGDIEGCDFSLNKIREYIQ